MNPIGIELSGRAGKLHPRTLELIFLFEFIVPNGLKIHHSSVDQSGEQWVC